MRIFGLLLVLTLGVGVAAQADPMPGKDARKLLFSPRGLDFELRKDSGLSADQVAAVSAILKQMKRASLANYYGALAVSPDFFDMAASDPNAAALSGLLQVTERLHTPQAAGRVALKACEAARGPKQAPCVIAAFVLPRRWHEQPLQMSVDATTAFKAYRKGRGPKAMATSPTTAAFGVGRGETAEADALADCNSRTGGAESGDCEIVIKD